MQLLTDNRGVSEVVGAILVFGVLIALLAIMQTQAIPAANQEVEFDHNQVVQGDMVKFHERASRVVASGSDESISVQVGTTYPTRLLFFNPRAPAGSIETSEDEQVTIENIQAENDQIAQYFGGDITDLSTRTIRYEPNYNEYENAPATVYEHGVLYNEFEDDYVFKNQGTVVDGRNINLHFAAGEYANTAPGSVSLDITAVSAPARPVSVRSLDSDEPINITLPTQLPQEAWEDILDEEDHVVPGSVAVDEDAGTVFFQLEEGVAYSLRMSQVGLERGIEEPGPEYIVPAEGDSIDIVQGGSGTAQFEVRDRYNNPVSGVDVAIETEGGTQIAEGSTDSEGRLSTSVSPDGDTTLVGSISDCNEDQCEAELDVNVFDTSINPSSRVELVDAAIDPDVEFLGLPFITGDYEGAKTTFKSEGLTYNPDRMRISHYHKDSGEAPEVAYISEDSEIDTDDPSTYAAEMDISGGFESVDELPAIDENEQDYFFAFDTDEDVERGDFFVIEFVYSNQEGRESRSLYFVSPVEE